MHAFQLEKQEATKAAADEAAAEAVAAEAEAAAAEASWNRGEAAETLEATAGHVVLIHWV